MRPTSFSSSQRAVSATSAAVAATSGMGVADSLLNPNLPASSSGISSSGGSLSSSAAESATSAAVRTNPGVLAPERVWARSVFSAWRGPFVMGLLTVTTLLRFPASSATVRC